MKQCTGDYSKPAEGNICSENCTFYINMTNNNER